MFYMTQQAPKEECAIMMNILDYGTNFLTEQKSTKGLLLSLWNINASFNRLKIHKFIFNIY